MEGGHGEFRTHLVGAMLAGLHKECMPMNVARLLQLNEPIKSLTYSRAVVRFVRRIYVRGVLLFRYREGSTTADMARSSSAPPRN